MIKKINSNLFALIFSSFLTILIFIKTDVLNYSHQHFQNFWDHHKYIWMAINHLDFNIAPFCWRIFIPFLVSILPFEISISFQIISLFSVALTGFFVFKIGQKIFNDNFLSFSMMLGYFSISYAVKYVIYDFWLPDAFAVLLMTSGIYFILQKRDLAFLIVMTIGALTKESVLFVLPLYYSLNAEKFFDLKILKKTVSISLIPIFVLIVIRLLIPSLNSNPEYLQTLPTQLKIVQYNSSEYSLKFLIREIAAKKLININLYFLYRITLYTFLIYFVLAFFDFKIIKSLSFRFFPFILLVYLQIFFAENEERLVSVAFLPIIISSISGLDKICSKFPYRNFSIIFLNTLFFLMVLNSGLFYGDWLIIRQSIILIFTLIILYIISRIKKFSS